MGRRKKVVSPNAHLYSRNPFYTLPDGRTIEKDEIIKIDGEWGGRFKFQEHVVRKDTGVEWIDCFEIQKGILCGWRSFKPDRIKALPKKRNKRKNTKV
jgi:hypothetical protein